MKQQVVAGGEDFLPVKQKQLQQHLAERGKKMQTIGNGNNRQKFHNQLVHQQQRRKWGDWSECSKDCLRTRHRRNCDDLIQAQNSTTSSLISNKSDSIGVPAASGSNRKRHVSGSGQDLVSGTTIEDEEEDLLLKAGEGAINEDEDYADVGEEDDEVDSCEKVDPSKTTEQENCTGGSCPLSSNQLSSSAEQAIFPKIVSGKIQNHQKSRDKWIAPDRHQQRPNNQIGVEQDGNSLLANDEIEYSSTRQRFRDSSESRLSPDRYLQEQHYHTKKNSKFHNQNHQVRGQHFQTNQGGNGSINSSAVGQTIINTNGALEGGDLTLSDTSQTTNNRNNEAVVATTGTTNAPDSAINSVWTRTMWPQHLLNGVSTSQHFDLNQSVSLIQWTILIGSLLSIVLLIMLILRKLFVSTFPSYQWMLAKQTLKSTSKLNQASAASLDCCQAASAAARHQTRNLSTSGTVAGSAGPNMLSHCVAVATATNSRSSVSSLFAGLKSSSTSSSNHNHHIHYPQASPIPPHHMCYAWRRQQQPPSDDIEGGVIGCGSGEKHRPTNNTTAHQYIVDYKGKSILSSSLGANFNADIYDLPANFAQESADSMTIGSTSTSGYNAPRTAISKPKSSNNGNDSSQSVISAHYNYDTLNSNYGNQALNEVHHDQQRLQQKHHMSAVEKGFHLPHNYPLQPQTSSSTSSSVNPVTCQVHDQKHTEQVEFNEDELGSSIIRMNNYKHQQTVITSLNEAKHRSPKVPKSQNRFDQTRFEGELVDSNGHSSSSTISGGSGSGAGGVTETTSSPSIQSTTAQMLSNAASCSFEQTLDQNDDFFPSTPPIFSNVNNNDNNSLNSIPSGSTGLSSSNHRANNGLDNINKLSSANAVQSQPNSPMFANQFTNRTGFGKLKQRTCRSHVPKQMSSTSRLYQTDCNEPDHGDLDLVDRQEQQLHSKLPLEQYRQRNSSESHCDSKTIDAKDQTTIRDPALEGRTHDEGRKDLCDMGEDRHHYEEITNHSEAI